MPFVSLTLAACSVFPLAEADCRSDDWQRRGYADGFSGQIPQDMRLVPECRSRHGLEVDRDAYLAGWAAGRDEWDRMIGSIDIGR